MFSTARWISIENHDISNEKGIPNHHCILYVFVTVYVMVGGQRIVIQSKCGEVSVQYVIMVCVILFLPLVTPAVLVTSHGRHSRDK